MFVFLTKNRIELLKKENCIIIKDIPCRKGVGETLRFPRVGKQAFAEGENVRNRGFLKSEPEASESVRWHEVPERASD